MFPPRVQLNQIEIWLDLISSILTSGSCLRSLGTREKSLPQCLAKGLQHVDAGWFCAWSILLETLDRANRKSLNWVIAGSLFVSQFLLQASSCNWRLLLMFTPMVLGAALRFLRLFT